MSQPIPRPTPQQLAWAELEYYGFVHFGMPTWAGNGRGSKTPGHLDPSLFNPEQLDCRQWAQVAKDAGMRMLVLTAKHHGGFCLWPSAHTDYSVKASAWRDGQGDVVGDCAKACEEVGLKFGLYLSPYDKHHDSHSREYHALYLNQVRELFDGRYGKITLLWMDGYNAANLRDSYDAWMGAVKALQPDTLLRRGWGPDGRWCGTESGGVGYPQWAMLDGAAAEQRVYDKQLGAADDPKALAAEMRLILQHGEPDGPDWLPAEDDPASWPNGDWFWYPEHPPLPEPKFDGWETSVWRNAILNRGLAPDRRGLLSDDVVAYLLACKANRETFLASAVPADALKRDGNRWEIALQQPGKVASVMLGEQVAQGQRVRRFTLEAHTPEGWRRVFAGQSIGRKQLVPFDSVAADRVRLTVEQSVAEPMIHQMTAFAEDPGFRLPTGQAARS